MSVSEFVNSKWVKKKQYRLNSVVLMVCTLCKYLNIFLTVCADVFLFN